MEQMTFNEDAIENLCTDGELENVQSEDISTMDMEQDIQ